jgi:hypothetical protein
VGAFSQPHARDGSGFAVEYATIGFGTPEGAGWYSLPPETSDAFGEYGLPGPNDPL